MKILVDIDGTICDSSNGYPTAIPIHKNIAKINKLYDEGNIIIYWTGRGRSTDFDWSELTRQQLINWGCKFHELNCNTKIAYDLIIDDKAKRIEEI